ncbi:hypothetical protein, partial [Nitratidesulfovibrio liaohensis]|uniref:hypothetical protein n=1 Tax=Nitratidesulfovibrio liaohensis TaxID=2604158 RepID=UPI0014200BB2
FLQKYFYSVNESVLNFARDLFGDLDSSNRYVSELIYFFAIMLTSVLFKSSVDGDGGSFYHGANFSSVLKMERFYISLRNKRAVGTAFRDFAVGQSVDMLEGRGCVEIYRNEFLRRIAMLRWAGKSRRGGVKDKAFAVVVLGRYSGKKLEKIFKWLRIIVEKHDDECVDVYRELRLQHSKAPKQKILNMLKNKITDYAMTHNLPMPPTNVKNLQGQKSKSSDA